MAIRRPPPVPGQPRRPLTIEQVLAWADYEFRMTGRWPRCVGGPLLADRSEKWRNIDQALRAGGRGLPRGSSLARLLAERRGARNLGALPPLTEELILAWADAWHARTGDWPRTDCGEEVPEAPGECWNNIDQSLRDGSRGLPGGDSLARLLARRRDHRNMSDLPHLTIKEILAWAKAHHRRTGRWPVATLLEIPEAPGESWAAVNTALRDGLRGLPGGESLPGLLARRLRVRNRTSVPPLSIRQIRQWAQDYRRRTGAWPTKNSGPVRGVRGETWMRVDTALHEGLRGLPGGSSLARLLKGHPDGQVGQPRRRKRR
jgi:hypothetical protein